ncbi:addiction module protein [Luteolibacter flavescens]|uniref:addiction module protein n=1 Tax=Luteolibacter flavescens TaxID=1859460 RepID=UPI003CCD45C6
MSLSEIVEEALKLPEDQRAQLAARLLGSLPPALSEPDEGSAEAKRRIDEMKRDPSSRRTWEEIKHELNR